LEAYRADAALSESVSLAGVREIIHDDDLSRGGGDEIAGSIDPFAARGKSLHSMTLLQPHQMDTSGVTPPYLVDKGRLYPAYMNARSSPLLFRDSHFNETDSRSIRSYGHSLQMYTNRNRYEPSSATQMQLHRHLSWAGAPKPGEQNNYNWSGSASKRLSLSVASNPALGPVVMGRRPDQEDSASQNWMMQNYGSLIQKTNHKLDPFEEHDNSKNTSGYSNPTVDPFGAQVADPFYSRENSRIGTQKQKDVLAVIHQMSSKSTETERSKYGETETDIGSRKQHCSKDTEPMFSTDPFEMSKSLRLERVLSDDSESSSNQANTEYNGKTKGAEEDNWGSLLKEVSAGLSSSSTEREVNAISTKMDTIYEYCLQNEEQQAGAKTNFDNKMRVTCK